MTDSLAVRTEPTAVRTSKKRGPRSRRAAKHVVLLIGAIVMIYPILWLLKSTITPESQILGTFSPIPEGFTFENYAEGWSSGAGGGFPSYIVNSLLVVIGCIIGNLISCSLAAYAFARLEFRLRNTMFALMLAGIMLPYHVVAVPQYVEFQAAGLVGTLWPLIIPKILATDAFFIFLMVQFLRGIPRQLDEAAAIDGASPLRTFVSVILPLMKPALITATIFTFIWNWNDFFGPLIYLTSPSLYTVSIGLNSLVSTESGAGIGPLFAMAVVSLIPVVAFFIFSQRYIINGIATTGLKG